MPSSAITAIFEAADTKLNALFGEEVTYTFSDSTTDTFTMDIKRGSRLDVDEVGNAVSYQAVGYPLISDVAKPTYGEKISTTGPDGVAEEWTVLKILRTLPASHEIALRSDLRSY